MRDGTEVEIVGGFKFGLKDDFVKVLGASRQIKVVHLDSVGGRLGEGKKLSEFIRDRGLTTYVSAKCMSACTLAFAGGRERYLLRGATLGFHKGSFPGVNEGTLDDVQRDVFRIAGFDPKFIQTALSTPHNDMWKPSSDVLLAARVITNITDASKFAVSGMGANLSRDKMASSIANALSLFQVMKDRFPQQFDRFVDEYHDGIQKGKTEAETIEIARAKLIPFIISQMPLADDDVLAEYNNVLIDQYASLNAKNPTFCYLYASGADPKTNIHNDLPPLLQKRERDVQERVLKTTVERPAISEGVLTAVFEKVRKQLTLAGMTDADFDLMESTKLEKSMHAAYCGVAIRFFRGILRLPQKENAMVMRHILAARK